MTGPSVSQSDNQLLHAAMQGDKKAFALFCQQVLPKLRLHITQLCRSSNLDPSFVGDFCNDTILRALDYITEQRKSASSGANPIRNADAWVKTIASNVVIDFVRKAVRRQEQSLDALPYDPQEAPNILTLEEVVELEDLFDSLTPRERQVMQLLYIDRLSVRDVAEKLRSTEDAVRKAHQRALRRLRGLMDEGEA